MRFRKVELKKKVALILYMALNLNALFQLFQEIKNVK